MGDRINVNITTSAIDTVQGGRVAQGRNQGRDIMAKTPRKKRSSARLAGGQPAIEDDARTDTSSLATEATPDSPSHQFATTNGPPHSVWEHKHQEKMRWCVENAVTYRLHSSGKSWEPRPDPVESHYNKLDSRTIGRIRDGYVLRIWKPDDVVMHLGTFAILFSKGFSWTTCKFIRATPSASSFDFNHYHAKAQVQKNEVDEEIPVAPTPTGANLRPVTVIAHELEGWYDDAWLNLERPYDLGFNDDYDFTYCGKLTTQSKVYAKDKTRMLFFPQ